MQTISVQVSNRNTTERSFVQFNGVTLGKTQWTIREMSLILHNASYVSDQFLIVLYFWWICEHCTELIWIPGGVSWFHHNDHQLQFRWQHDARCHHPGMYVNGSFLNISDFSVENLVIDWVSRPALITVVSSTVVMKKVQFLKIFTSMDLIEIKDNSNLYLEDGSFLGNQPTRRYPSRLCHKHLEKHGNNEQCDVCK